MHVRMVFIFTREVWIWCMLIYGHQLSSTDRRYSVLTGGGAVWNGNPTSQIIWCSVILYLLIMYRAMQTSKHKNTKDFYLIPPTAAFCEFSDTFNKKSLVNYLSLNPEKLGVNPWDPEIVLKTFSVGVKPWDFISLCLLLRLVTGQCWRSGSGESRSHPRG